MKKERRKESKKKGTFYLFITKHLKCKTNIENMNSAWNKKGKKKDIVLNLELFYISAINMRMCN